LSTTPEFESIIAKLRVVLVNAARILVADGLKVIADTPDIDD
jgi:hypothetical protein